MGSIISSTQGRLQSNQTHDVNNLIIKIGKTEEKIAELIHEAPAIDLYNQQQNVRGTNITMIDIREIEQFEDYHIDLSHHCQFIKQLNFSNANLFKNNSGNNSNKNNLTTVTQWLEWKQWLRQIICKHQSPYSKSKITFYIIDNTKPTSIDKKSNININNVGAGVGENINIPNQVLNTIKWLNALANNYDTDCGISENANANESKDNQDNNVLDVSQVIEDGKFYFVDFNNYLKEFPYCCIGRNINNEYYVQGCLYPSKINDNIYLSNWGVASNGIVYQSMLNNFNTVDSNMNSNDDYNYNYSRITSIAVINCTKDHPSIFNINEKDIYNKEMTNDIENELAKEKENEDYKWDDVLLQRQHIMVEKWRNDDFKQLRINYLRIPIVDNMDENVLQYFESAMRFIEQQTSDIGDHDINSCKDLDKVQPTEMKSNEKVETRKGEKRIVIVHCRHGQSRSATVVAAWLIYHCNMTVDQAIQFLRKQRPVVSPNKGFIKQLNLWSDSLSSNKL